MKLFKSLLFLEKSEVIILKTFILSAVVSPIVGFFVQKALGYFYPIFITKTKTALLKSLKWAVRKLES